MRKSLLFSDQELWTMKNAPKLAKRANAQVIAIDWGTSELSCCSYPILLFCHMNAISAWMAKCLRNCATIAPSTSISNTWMIGHSVGAQFMGSTAKHLIDFGEKLEKLIGLDPASPLFMDKFDGGKCQGIAPDFAHQTMIFLTNPGSLGIDHTNLANVNVYCNMKKGFCQYGCECNNPMCNHFYVSQTLFDTLADGTPLIASYLNDERLENVVHKVTIYETMKSGLYDIDSDNNPTLQKLITKRENDEL